MQFFLGALRVKDNSVISSTPTYFENKESPIICYDFTTLYTTLPHNLTKEKRPEFIEHMFNSEGSFYLARNEKRAFSLLNNLKDIMCYHV